MTTRYETRQEYDDSSSDDEIIDEHAEQTEEYGESQVVVPNAEQPTSRERPTQRRKKQYVWLLCVATIMARLILSQLTYSTSVLPADMPFQHDGRGTLQRVGMKKTWWIKYFVVVLEESETCTFWLKKRTALPLLWLDPAGRSV